MLRFHKIETVGLGLLVVALGCSHDTTGPLPRDPAMLPWTLTVNHYAVTLSTAAPYDTVQLTAALHTAGGVPLSGAVITYQSSDVSSAVVDSSTGLVTARGTTNQALIVARATLAGVTVQDTTVVRVNATGNTPSLPTRLLLQGTENPLAPSFQPVPPPGEGLTVDCEGVENSSFYGVIRMRSVQLTTQLLTADGTDLVASGEAIVDYRSSAPRVMDVTHADGFDYTQLYGNSRLGSPPGTLQEFCEDGHTGPVTITATATVYGVTVRDSILITVIPALVAFVDVVQHTPQATGQPINDFSPKTVTIGSGGIVLWFADSSSTPLGQPTDVVFDVPDPVHAALGVDTLALGVFLYKPYRYPRDPAGGNIAPFRPTDTLACVVGCTTHIGGVRARQFPVSGIYHYHSARYGTGGIIVVLP